MSVNHQRVNFVKSAWRGVSESRAFTPEVPLRPRPLKLRNEPEEFFNPVKRPKDPNERKPKRPQPSVPQFKCLSD